MANEISIAVDLRVSNAPYTLTQTKRLQVDQTAIGEGGSVQVVGTTEEALDFGDVSTLGWLYLENLDDTNFVEYGPDSTGMVAFGKLEAGECAILRLKPGITVKAKADTAECKVLVRCLED
jgi:hypothetical protein